VTELCAYTGASGHQFWMQRKIVYPILALLAFDLLLAPALSPQLTWNIHFPPVNADIGI